MSANVSSRSWPRLIGGGLLLVLVLGLAGFQLALHLLKGQIAAALGPQGEVREIRVGLAGVEVLGVRLPARQEAGRGKWPAEDLLRAERIVVVPSLADLFSARVVLRSIRVEGGYLSLLRTREGRLRVLPGLTESAGQAPAEAEGGGPAIRIGEIQLVDSAVEFFDASVRQPPLKIRLEQLNASLGPLSLPDLQGESRLQVAGVLKGVRQDGRVSIAGRVELASKESSLNSQLRGVDLIALQPYLIKAAETGVRRGSLDLDLQTTVSKGILHGPGTLTLQHLELSSSGTGFMGMPRSAVVGMMKDRQGEISIKFVLAGNINDPAFSLNENLMTKVGTAMAASLGVSLEGLAKGVGSAGGSVVEGVGESLGKLFGK